MLDWSDARELLIDALRMWTGVRVDPRATASLYLSEFGLELDTRFSTASRTFTSLLLSQLALTTHAVGQAAPELTESIPDTSYGVHLVKDACLYTAFELTPFVPQGVVEGWLLEEDEPFQPMYLAKLNWEGLVEQIRILFEGEDASYRTAPGDIARADQFEAYRKSITAFVGEQGPILAMFLGLKS